MSDLKKLMEKMKDNKKTEEKPVEVPVEQQTPAPAPKPTPAPVEKVAPAPIETLDDEDEDDDVEEGSVEEVEQVPVKQEDDHNSIEQEVAVLQNVGIFRREMIIIEKEKVDVLKVIAQTLLDIKKKLLGEIGEEDAPPK